MDIVRATRFCEAVYDGIANPANAWSSILFFGTVAILLLAYTVKHKRYIHGSRLYSYLFIGVVGLIGVTSFWNHATLSFWGGVADFESMYLLVTLVILLGISQLRLMSSKSLITIWLLINIPLTYIAGQAARISDYTFMALVGLVVVLEFMQKTNKKYLLLSLLSIGVGYFIWQLDVRGIWCDPQSIWQGHAVWHLLTAVAAGLFYLYLLEKPEQLNT